MWISKRVALPFPSVRGVQFALKIITVRGEKRETEVLWHYSHSFTDN